MDVETGVYAPSKEMLVTVWKKPDADGPGAEVWRERYSGNGEHMGRERVTDLNGRPIKEYDPPKGFQNFPSFDHQDNWVRMNGDRIYRNPAGEAVSIRPGTVLVEYADGTNTLIEDEYQQYLFSLAHQRVDEGVDDVSLPSSTEEDAEDVGARVDADTAAKQKEKEEAAAAARADAEAAAERVKKTTSTKAATK